MVERRRNQRVAGLAGQIAVIVLLVAVIIGNWTQIADLKTQNARLQQQVTTNHAVGTATLQTILAEENRIEAQVRTLAAQK